MPPLPPPPAAGRRLRARVCEPLATIRPTRSFVRSSAFGPLLVGPTTQARLSEVIQFAASHLPHLTRPDAGASSEHCSICSAIKHVYLNLNASLTSLRSDINEPNFNGFVLEIA